MSEEPARYGIARRAMDGDWSVRAVVDEGPPKTYTVVIDDNGTVTRVQLSVKRAQALIRQLTYMLEDSDERVRSVGTPWSEIKHKKNPLKVPVDDE